MKRIEHLERDDQIRHIRAVARRNLENTLRIMHFLRGHRIPLYRMSAQLIPLATHPVTDGWAWWEDGELVPLMEKIGEQVKVQGVRISSHLPHVCQLSAPHPDKLIWTHKYLAYHRRLFDAMELDERAKIVLHLGGSHGDRRRAAEIAVANVAALPAWARRRLCLENDDKVFSAAEVLAVCRRAGVPMVFDYHHHVCRHDGEDVADLLPEVFATWMDRPPKVHLSSPRSPDNPRAHADYVDVSFIRPFLNAAQGLGDFDIMVEAKKKDLALFKLRAELGLEP